MSESSAVENVRMFQIYFRPDQKSGLDSAFVPFDNTSNERPDLREWYSWSKIHNSDLVSDVDYWGAVSSKFGKKAHISGQSFLNFVNNNPGYDVYYVCPSWMEFKSEHNSWVQGDIGHKTISKTATKIVNRFGYNVDLRSLKMRVHFYCNFFVANKKFWFSYMNFIDTIFQMAKVDSVLNDEVFAPGRSNYDQDPMLPMFPFIIERMTPTFIILNNYKSLAFPKI